jgi:hypothetical protein
MIAGAMNCIACNSDSGLVSFPWTDIIISPPANTQLSIASFAVAYKLARVEFRNSKIYNSELVAVGSQCLVDRGGVIEKNGLALPCADAPTGDGKIYP